MHKRVPGMANLSSYIDDISIHIETWEEHTEVLRELFSRLRNAGLAVKAKQYMFRFDKLDYIGHLVVIWQQN